MEGRRGQAELRRKDLQTPRAQIQAENQAVPPDHSEGHRGAFLPVTERPRDDSPVPKGEVGMGRHR